MFQAFVVTSREACELLLVVFALLAWTRRAERPELGRWVLAGVPAGFAIAAAVLAALPPSGLNEWFDIALTFFVGLSLALLSSGTMASVAGIGRHATRVFDAWFAKRPAGALLLAFVAFGALRETLEAVLLVRFIAARESSEDVAWGIGLGLLACALLATAWRALRDRRGAHRVFRLSAVILFVLGAQMMIEAMAEALLRGVGGRGATHLAHTLQPYLEEGDRYWMLCAALAAIPLALWTREWWRRAAD